MAAWQLLSLAVAKHIKASKRLSRFKYLTVFKFKVKVVSALGLANLMM